MLAFLCLAVLAGFYSVRYACGAVLGIEINSFKQCPHVVLLLFT